MKSFCIIILLITLVAVCLYCCTTPVNNKEPATIEALGEKLFFDSILSLTQTVSCASCHKPQFAFADTAILSPGIFNRRGVRNTPSAMNLTGQVSFFWDGRAATLEQQALMPIANPDEMGLPIDSAINRLRRHPVYNPLFLKIFKQPPGAATLAKALAAFQRTLETPDAPFDDWRINDNEKAISESAKRGFHLSVTKPNVYSAILVPILITTSSGTSAFLMVKY